MEKSTTKEPTPSEKLEYEQANNWWRTLSGMRRRDIALFTAAQGAIVAIIGDTLLELQALGYALSFIAFIIAIIGFNNERRLYRYLYHFRQRAISIEKDHKMSLITKATEEVEKLRVSPKSSWAFELYYAIFAIGWIALWVINATMH